MTSEPATHGGAPKVNVIIMSSINVCDLARMKSGDSGSQEMATMQRFFLTTTPVYNPYDDPEAAFDVPAYLMEEGVGREPRRDQSGWKRHMLKPPRRFARRPRMLPRRRPRRPPQRRRHGLLRRAATTRR